MDELNDGAIDALAGLSRAAPVGKVIEAAAVAGGALSVPQRATRLPLEGHRRQIRRRNGLFDEILVATDRLRTGPVPPATGQEWQERLEAVAEVWGDGWVLRQATAALPTTMDLDGVAVVVATRNEVLSQVVIEEARARANRADASWWRERLDQSSNDFERRDWLVKLLTRAHAGVVVALAVEINGVAEELTPKHFAALRDGLLTPGRRQLGGLRIQDSLRLRQVDFTARALWLLRPLATESTAEQIDKQLMDRARDVLGLGVGDLRDLIRAVGRRKAVPVELLRGARRVLPPGVWTGEVRFSVMPRKLVGEVLAAPGDWPSDVVQQALQSTALRPASAAKPLIRLAEEDHWFRIVEPS